MSNSDSNSNSPHFAQMQVQNCADDSVDSKTGTQEFPLCAAQHYICSSYFAWYSKKLTPKWGLGGGGGQNSRSMQILLKLTCQKMSCGHMKSKVAKQPEKKKFDIFLTRYLHAMYSVSHNCGNSQCPHLVPSVPLSADIHCHNME